MLSEKYRIPVYTAAALFLLFTFIEGVIMRWTLFKLFW